jgi:hypothetical protein
MSWRHGATVTALCRPRRPAAVLVKVWSPISKSGPLTAVNTIVWSRAHPEKNSTSPVGGFIPAGALALSSAFAVS